MAGLGGEVKKKAPCSNCDNNGSYFVVDKRRGVNSAGLHYSFRWSNDMNFNSGQYENLFRRAINEWVNLTNIEICELGKDANLINKTTNNTRYMMINNEPIPVSTVIIKVRIINTSNLDIVGTALMKATDFRQEEVSLYVNTGAIMKGNCGLRYIKNIFKHEIGHLLGLMHSHVFDTKFMTENGLNELTKNYIKAGQESHSRDVMSYKCLWENTAINIPLSHNDYIVIHVAVHLRKINRLRTLKEILGEVNMNQQK